MLSALLKGVRWVLHSLQRYADWLHLQWPAGTVEQLPRVDEHFRTNVDGVYVVGDLAGVPLLKFSVDGGVNAVRDIVRQERVADPQAEAYDVVILGAGASGMAAAREAEEKGLSYCVLEARRRFATIHDFQKEKPIYTYPNDMTPAGDLQVTADVREALIEELEAQTQDIPVRHAEAHRIDRRSKGLEVVTADEERIAASNVVVAIGRSGNFRDLEVPGGDKDHVHHRLYDPTRCAGEDVVVIGGGDSAAEAAIALVEAGARVTLSYRRSEFVRPKEENAERLRELAGGSSASGELTLRMPTDVEAVTDEAVVLSDEEGHTESVPARQVFAMIGREAPLDFFRRSGIELRNDWGDLPNSLDEALGSLDWLRRLNWGRIAAFASFFLFMAAIYSWKDGGWLGRMAQSAELFPFGWSPGADGDGLLAITLTSMTQPGFYYTFAYSALVVIFGVKRIRRRKTPYIRVQTLTLMTVQVLPLFLLPEIVLPFLGENGLLPTGLLDALFPASEGAVHGRQYWRAYGFILAWPLFIWNVFTSDPLWWWLAICFVQTFVLIPGMIYFWGKGAYCGWICTCGALAETLGDQHRDKMPHGEGWNKLNLAGQVIMVLAFVLLALRIVGWIWPESGATAAFWAGLAGEWLGLQLNYSWLVDVILA
ncbi:MAG: NAD(P)-binding domain-containing protein, partial [Salinivenus sp.]